jgi:hypothetical protein
MVLQLAEGSAPNLCSAAAANLDDPRAATQEIAIATAARPGDFTKLPLMGILPSFF